MATPRSEDEKNDVEKLRSRAVRNAIDLAVMLVSGVSISTEKGDSIRTREDDIVVDGKQEQKLVQQSRFRAAATSRAEGHARLVEIVREWEENGNYYVNLSQKSRKDVDP